MDSQHNHSASLETSSSAAQPNTGIVIYGPQGCGKTTHAAALARHYGKTRIVDDWTPGGPVPADTLVLTNVPHGRAISFLDAARAAGIRLPTALARALAANGRAG